MYHFSSDFIDWFRQATPYINTHKGKIFVFHIGLAIDQQAINGVVQDLALLKSLNINIIVIFADQLTHGEDEPVDDEKLAQAQLAATRHYHQLCAGMTIQQEAGELSLHVCQGNWIIARPVGIVKGIDYLHKGSIRRISMAGMAPLLREGHIVFCNAICNSQTGSIYHVNTLEIAVQLAKKLAANKLIFIENESIVDQHGGLIREISETDLQGWLQHYPQSSKITRLLGAAYQAYEAVERIHLIDIQEKNALLNELFSLDGAGTLISRHHTDIIDKAAIGDINRIIELIRPLEQQGILVYRSRKKLENELDNFLVMKRDNHVIGCVAIYPVPDSQTAELACLVIDPEYHNAGRGSRLLNKAEAFALVRGLKTLYLLTTHTYEWFSERGFVIRDSNALPEGSFYNQTRKSKVLLKHLKA